MNKPASVNDDQQPEPAAPESRGTVPAEETGGLGPLHFTATHYYRELAPEEWGKVPEGLTLLPTPGIGRVFVAISLRPDSSAGQVEGVRCYSPVGHSEAFGAVDGSGVAFGAFDPLFDLVLPKGTWYYALVENNAGALAAALQGGMEPVGEYVLCARRARGAATAEGQVEG